MDVGFDVPGRPSTSLSWKIVFSHGFIPAMKTPQMGVVSEEWAKEAAGQGQHLSHPQHQCPEDFVRDLGLQGTDHSHICPSDFPRSRGRCGNHQWEMSLHYDSWVFKIRFRGRPFPLRGCALKLLSASRFSEMACQGSDCLGHILGRM